MKSWCFCSVVCRVFTSKDHPTPNSFTRCLIMKLAIVLLAFLGVASLKAETHVLSNVTVSRMEGVTFFNLVTDIKKDFDGKTLLVLDSHALWRLDPTRNSKQLIAGYTNSYGYIEGVGLGARFYTPSGILNTRNKTVVSDTYNHCLREVDLVTRNTSQLAGICTKRGTKDGNSTKVAQFYMPRGLLAYKSGILIADYYAIKLLDGGMVTTMVKGSHVGSPRYLTEIDGQVFYTSESALLRLYPETKAVQLVAGHESIEGFSDGPLFSARFQDAQGLVSPGPGVILIANSYGSMSTVRLVDLVGKKVTSVCTGKPGTLDGYGDKCQMYYPWSIEVFGKTIYIGQSDGKIRTIPLQSITDESTCTTVQLDVALEPGEEFTSVNISGHELLVPAGRFQFKNKPISGTVCTTVIKVTGQEVCPAANVNLKLQPGEKAIKYNVDEIEIYLTAGIHKVDKTLSDDTVCETRINVTETVEVACPDHIRFQLFPGEASTNVTWEKPNIIGEQDLVKCVSCPHNSQKFEAGVHTVDYEFRYTPTDYKIHCSFDVVVVSSYQSASQCKSRLTKGKRIAEFNITAPNGSIFPLEFPVGLSLLKIESEEGECTKTVEVYDTAPVRNSIDLGIVYPITCSKLTPLAWALINSSLLYHYTDLVTACPECDLPKDQDSADIQCSSDLLSVTWKTNLKLPDQTAAAWNIAKATLTSLLRKYQESKVKSTGRYFELTVIVFTPPFVAPVKGSDGLYVSPMIISTCPQPEMVYDKDDDSCYVPYN